MKKKLFFHGLILLLLLNIILVSIIILLIKNVFLLNDKVTDYKNKEAFSSFKIEHYANVIKWLQRTNQISFPPELVLENENGAKVTLSTLVEGKPKLFFRYTELNCHVCVDSQMVFIKNFINKHGSQNFVMISNYKYKKSIFQFKSLNKISNEIFNVEILDTTLARLNIPFYFILDKNCNPIKFHFPDKAFPEDTKEYFKSIENLYFQEIQ